jgi:hypothetical protein
MINQNEKKWLWYATVITIVLTTLPYVFAYLRAGQEWQFSGFLFGVEDGNSYIAKMLRGVNGVWLFKTPYTTMDQKGFVGYLPFLFLGKFAAGEEIHEQLIGLFQIFRWTGIYYYILGSYSLISRFIEKVSLRRLGTALCVAGGGLGWLFVVGLGGLWQERLPLEFYSPESFGFLSIFGLPHLAMARGFLLLGISHFILAMNEPVYRKNGYIISGGLLIAVGFMQPMTVLVGWMVICGYWLVYKISRIKNENNRFRHFIQAFIKEPGFVIGISSPLVLYTIIAFQLDPFLKGWAAQNKILSPPFADYLLAYGVSLIIIGYSIWQFRKELFARATIMLLWVILLPLLAYFPYSIQRRLPEGIWTAFIIIVLISMELSQGWKKKVIHGLAISSFLSTVIFIAGSFISTAQPAAPLFRPTPEMEVIQELAKVSSVGDVVFANYDHSNSIPAWVPVTVIIGHGPESIHQEDNITSVNQILSGNYSSENTRRFLTINNVRYIFLSPENLLMNTSLNAIRSCFSLVTETAGYQLYRMITQCP